MNTATKIEDVEITLLPVVQLMELHDCVVELQNYEKNIDAGKKAGEEIAGEYLRELAEDLKNKQGKVWVITHHKEISGFVSCYVENETTDQQEPFLYVSDLFLKEELRGKSIADMLIGRVEEYAKEIGIRFLRIGVLEGNERAAAFYKKQGFKPYEKVLVRDVR
jgi:ribosomal protein S18 acetylase RimI-like enzyme